MYEEIRLESPVENKLTKPGRKLAKHQLVFAFFITCSAALISYSGWGAVHAQSAFVGGMIAIIPNVFFALKAFRYAGAKSSKQVVESFYSGEKYKLVITAVLFALVFKFLSITPVPLFGTYCVAVVLPLLTPFLFKL